MDHLCRASKFGIDDHLMVSPEQIDHFLRAALRQRGSRWPNDWSSRTIEEQVSDRILYHGIAGLLLELDPLEDGWPTSVVQRIRHETVGRAKWELRHKDLLSRVFGHFAQANIPFALMKGTALAYSVFDSPAHRFRGDTDLLIPRELLAKCRVELTRLGFERSTNFGDDPAFELQESWKIEQPDGSDHVIDVHWQVLNAPSLRSVLPAQDCLDRAVPLPALSSSARRFSASDALLLACVHRAMHITAPYIVNGNLHYGGDRILWLVDIDRLVRSFAPSDWDALLEVARSSEIAAVAFRGLSEAQEQIGTSVPDKVLAQLASPANSERHSAYLLEASNRKRAIADLKSIKGAKLKIRFLLSRVFPSPDFMRSKYSALRGAPLPFLYAYRVWDWASRKFPGRNA